MSKKVSNEEIIWLINELAINVKNGFIWSDKLRKTYEKAIKHLSS